MPRHRFEADDLLLFESDEARIRHVVESAEHDYKQILADALPGEIIVPEEDYLENLWEQTYTFTSELQLRGEKVTVYCLVWLDPD